MFKYVKPTFGCDPELFLKDRNGNYIPACGLVGGTKKRPKKIDKLGHAVQEDNVMVEFNIPPAKSEDAVVASVTHVLDYLSKTLPQFELSIDASADFSLDELKKHPKAFEFGCDPDYNAWKEEINESPSINTTIRTCGGHIHVGYSGANITNQIALIKAMDLFLGVPLVEMDPDTVRKSRYGKAGAFRPKPYGVEWRVGSNFWIKTPELIRWAYRNTMRAIEYLNSGNMVSEELGNEIQHIINTGDVAGAKFLAHKFLLV